MTANCYGGSNVAYMLILHSKCCINVLIGSRLNTWSGYIWNVPNLLSVGKWRVPSTRAYNVLKMFLLVSRPPRPQWLLIGWRVFACPRSTPPSSLSGWSPSSLSYLPIIVPSTRYRLTPPHHMVPWCHVFDWLTLHHLTQVRLSLLPFGTFPFLFHSFNPQRVPHTVVVLLHHSTSSPDTTLFIGQWVFSSLIFFRFHSLNFSPVGYLFILLSQASSGHHTFLFDSFNITPISAPEGFAGSHQGTSSSDYFPTL